MKIFQSFLILALATSPIMAQNNQNPTIDVTGEGIVRAVPDEVNINIRVENTGKNTRDLKKQNDATISEVLKFLKLMSIPEKDIRTEYMNLSKNYDYNSKTYSFAANQALSVKLRDMSKYEQVMNGLLDTGINRIDGVEFSSSNNEALESQARKKAVQNAQMKAKEYASVLGQTVGKALSISEDRNVSGPRPLYKMATMEMSASDSQPAIAPGELEIRTTINVTFLMEMN